MILKQRSSNNLDIAINFTVNVVSVSNITHQHSIVLSLGSKSDLAVERPKVNLNLSFKQTSKEKKLTGLEYIKALQPFCLMDHN